MRVAPEKCNSVTAIPLNEADHVPVATDHVEAMIGVVVSIVNGVIASGRLTSCGGGIAETIIIQSECTHSESTLNVIVFRPVFAPVVALEQDPL